MFVSVITCTHNTDNYPNILDTVASLLNQTYPETEIIIVIDGNERLREKIATTYKTKGNIQVVALEKNRGVSRARELGVRRARGDILAFIDDDSVAEKRWIEDLVNTFQKRDAIAVGGKILPIWLVKKPDYLPEELYWLVGLTYKGFAKEGVTEVRNAFGTNMSFKKEVFEKVGSFNETFGVAKERNPHMQAEEAEYTLRMKNKLGKGVIYNPELIVYHKVPKSKTRLGTLLKRAFYQGSSKALLKRLSPSPIPLANEESYLKALLFNYIPRRMGGVFLRPNPLAEIEQLMFLFVSIFVVGLGFIYGYFKSGLTKWNLHE